VVIVEEFVIEPPTVCSFHSGIFSTVIATLLTSRVHASESRRSSVSEPCFDANTPRISLTTAACDPEFCRRTTLFVP
jgi:hypothetical protein